MIGGATPST